MHIWYPVDFHVVMAINMLHRLPTCLLQSLKQSRPSVSDICQKNLARSGLDLIQVRRIVSSSVQRSKKLHQREMTLLCFITGFYTLLTVKYIVNFLNTVLSSVLGQNCDVDWNWQRVSAFSHCLALTHVLHLQIISYSDTKHCFLLLWDVSVQVWLNVYKLIFLLHTSRSTEYRCETVKMCTQLEFTNIMSHVLPPYVCLFGFYIWRSCAIL